ncbi:MAG: D-alanyl-D-alanine carboxypeptidase family protein [Clostridia bacterium]|nr:D-alanyl-D-alanine carboxypeptidase family protein [Clostridia bacterium]
MLKKLTALTLSLLIFTTTVQAEPPAIDAKSYILMEASTGTILSESNSEEPLPPASVTKIMTLLLIYDSVNSGKIKWTDMVSVSEHAASMGGSQIFLEPNEQQSAETLTKSIAIASANDAAVAMAEFIAGSEESFVAMMNEKAKELGMKNTTFVNACGLDTEGHKMSAKDIAIMSRELITKYPDVKKYTTTWQDTITHTTSKGTTEFGLTNTNKLIKWYKDATGLKTGSTGKALYCLSGTALRDGMELIAVVMAAPDPKVRFQTTMKLLDYGFANYKLQSGKAQGEIVGQVPVYKGMSDMVNGAVASPVNMVTPKENTAELDFKTELAESINAPVKKGDKIGEIIYYSNNNEIARCNIIANEDIEKANLTKNIARLFQMWLQ